MSVDFSGAYWSFHRQVWSTARVTGPIKVITKDVYGRRETAVKGLEIEVKGDGRPVIDTTPRAFWRSFAGMDFSDDAAVEDFIRRKGDPQGMLSTETRTTDTAEWPGIAEALQPLAGLWGPIEDDGVSRIGTNGDAVADAIRGLVEHPLMHPPGVTLSFDVLVESGSLVVLAKIRTLASYMAISAAILASARADMRSCERCSDFFVPGRTDARYCGSVCRTAASIERTTKRKGN